MECKSSGRWHTTAHCGTGKHQSVVILVTGTGAGREASCTGLGMRGGLCGYSHQGLKSTLCLGNSLARIMPRKALEGTTDSTPGLWLPLVLSVREKPKPNPGDTLSAHQSAGMDIIRQDTQCRMCCCPLLGKQSQHKPPQRERRTRVDSQTQGTTDGGRPGRARVML